ncbi:fluoride efflux transporter FluC [Ornithinibacillus xuwenensis]|uniref:Fluoride-specific ion channel FluC n=1 Tax=Ornithinibacillus xuwenensis TaxID=3144668 RepID=A0ABU9XJC0_9BACI
MSEHLKQLKIFLAIGIGGMIGAASRYGISIGFPVTNKLPIETLIANLIGCFLLSYLLHVPFMKNTFSKESRIGITTGILGAFTTFSTFAVETVVLGEVSILLATGYVIISLIGGITLCFCGYWMANRRRESI